MNVDVNVTITVRIVLLYIHQGKKHWMHYGKQ